MDASSINPRGTSGIEGLHVSRRADMETAYQRAARRDRLIAGWAVALAFAAALTDAYLSYEQTMDSAPTQGNETPVVRQMQPPVGVDLQQK